MPDPTPYRPDSFRPPVSPFAPQGGERIDIRETQQLNRSVVADVEAAVSPLTVPSPSSSKVDQHMYEAAVVKAVQALGHYQEGGAYGNPGQSLRLFNLAYRLPESPTYPEQNAVRRQKLADLQRDVCGDAEPALTHRSSELPLEAEVRETSRGVPMELRMSTRALGLQADGSPDKAVTDLSAVSPDATFHHTAAGWVVVGPDGSMGYLDQGGTTFGRQSNGAAEFDTGGSITDPTVSQKAVFVRPSREGDGEPSLNFTRYGRNGATVTMTYYGAPVNQPSGSTGVDAPDASRARKLIEGA